MGLGANSTNNELFIRIRDYLRAANTPKRKEILKDEYAQIIFIAAVELCALYRWERVIQTAAKI
jgi:hypothetical protein